MLLCILHILRSLGDSCSIAAAELIHNVFLCVRSCYGWLWIVVKHSTMILGVSSSEVLMQSFCMRWWLCGVGGSQWQIIRLRKKCAYLAAVENLCIRQLGDGVYKNQHDLSISMIFFAWFEKKDAYFFATTPVVVKVVVEMEVKCYKHTQPKIITSSYVCTTACY